MKLSIYFLLSLVFLFLVNEAHSQCSVSVTATPDTICSGASSQLNAVVSPSLNYVVEQIPFAPDTSGGTPVFLDEDAVSDSLPIGFVFRFYDHDYTSFRISSNGFITFDATNAEGCCSGQLLPNPTPPDNLVAFAWEDYSPEYGGTISYLTDGIAPNRRLVVRFDSLPHFYNYNGVDPVTSQIILYETSNWIEIHTLSMPGNTSGNWLFHTEGIENAGGTIGIAVPGRNASNTWTAYNDAWRFTPQEYSFSWSPVSSLSDAFVSNPVASPDSTIEYVVVVSDSATNCVATSSVTVFVETCSGVESGDQPSFKIHPNPAIDKIELITGISPGKEIQIEMVDSYGKIIFGEDGVSHGSITINVTGYAPGIYFLNVLTGMEVLHSKFMIVR